MVHVRDKIERFAYDADKIKRAGRKSLKSLEDNDS